MRRLFAIVLVAHALAGCQSPEDVLSDARERLEQALADERTTDEARRTAVAGVESALGALGPEAAPCPIDVELGLLDPRVAVVDEREVPTAPGPWLATLEHARTDILAEILLVETPTRQKASEIATRVDEALSPWAWDVSIVVDSRTYPRFDADEGYHPGVFEGFVAVWDRSAGRLACVARVVVTNSPDVLDRALADAATRAEFERDPIAWLEADLFEVALDAADNGLVALP